MPLCIEVTPNGPVRRTVVPFVVESRPCGHTPLSGEEKFDVARLHAYALLLRAKSRSDARGVVRAGRVIATMRNLVSHPSAACMRMQWELVAAARLAAARVGVGDHGRVTLTTTCWRSEQSSDCASWQCDLRFSRRGPARDARRGFESQPRGADAADIGPPSDLVPRRGARDVRSRAGQGGGT